MIFLGEVIKAMVVNTELESSARLFCEKYRYTGGGVTDLDEAFI